MNRTIATYVALTLGVLCLISPANAQPSTQATFHIAPNGNDNNPGTQEQPFATVERARNAVRQQIARALTNHITVLLRGGTYPISRPLEFSVQDSGTDQWSITYAAVPGESPVITGGKTITGWRAESNGTWTTTVQDAKEARWHFRELFANGQRRTRARHPNNDYFRIVQAGPDRRTSFTFKEGDIGQYDNVPSIELVFLHDWSVSRIRLNSIDPTTKTITVVNPIGANSPHFAIDNFEKNPRYFLENSNSFLDAPGEWFLNSNTGILSYKPMPGETIENTRIVAPLSTSLLEVKGDPGTKRFVKNLRFAGIKFEHCAWPIPAGGYAEVQAAFHESRSNEKSSQRGVVPPAITVEAAESCQFLDLQLAHLGGSGIWIGRECRNTLISGSTLHDISGNGIMIGETPARIEAGKPWWQSAPEQATSGTIVTNCLIENCGTQFYGAVGLWVGFAQRTTITRNEIRNLPYTGISVGWRWDPTPTPCKANVVEYNYIHHIMQILSDGGGIYTLGRQPGSILRGNVIHDVTVNLGRAESNGMFLDEGTTEILVENNVIYNIARSPLRFHQAGTNVVSNNLLLTGKEIPHIRFNSTPVENIRDTMNEVRPQEELETASVAERVQVAKRKAGLSRIHSIRKEVIAQ